MAKFSLWGRNPFQAGSWDTNQTVSSHLKIRKVTRSLATRDFENSLHVSEDATGKGDGNEHFHNWEVTDHQNNCATFTSARFIKKAPR